MRCILLFFVSLSFVFAGVPQANDIARGFGAGSKEVPLATDGYSLPNGVGPTDRLADHATVAMNENRDIVVAYHSRRDIFGLGGIKLNQVEIAYYEHDDVSDDRATSFL